MNELYSLSSLFEKKLLRIPDYQRGYAWQEEQLAEFWEDLANLQPDRYHYTGMVSLKPLKYEDTVGWGDDRWLLETNYTAVHVIDGQQRLTTTVILINELLDFIRGLDENKGKADNQIVLAYETLEDITNTFICKKRPPNQLVTTYIFSYEADNPSAEYLKHRIFGAPNAGTLEETYYTRNLLYAKNFFQKNIEALHKLEGIDGITSLYRKVTQRMMFVQHSFSDDYDVFIAFETMNNRGKRLTNLELLKNRLIYLTTLYPDSVCDQADKVSLRAQINAAWKEVYSQMGRSETQLLSDDEFLRAHWIVYFSYSRRTGTDYIDYLLKKFSAKNIFEKKTVGIGISDDGSSDGQEEKQHAEEAELNKSLLPTEIFDYVNSLKNMAKHWYDTYFPYESSLSQEEKLWIDRLNRIGIGYFRPLVAVSLCQKQFSASEERVELYKAIERFIFVSFRIGNFNATFRSSDFHRYARSIYFNKESLTKVIDELNAIVDEYAEYAFDGFAARISKFFDQGNGYYSWSTLRYFLYEYEYSLAVKFKIDRISWNLFSKSERDKVSIEHIFPQTHTKFYWQNLYRAYTDEEKTILSGALGNLLPLSQSVNSALQNDSFHDKKSSKTTGRRGYENGSHSEIEVAKETDWSAEKIYDRSRVLLDFMCKRWNVAIEKETYERLLYISFVHDGRAVPPELTDTTPEQTNSSALPSGHLEEMQLQFWNGFVEYCKSIGRDEDLASRKPGKQNWYDIPVGANDYHLSFALSWGRYLSLVIYTYGPDTYARFESKRAELEKAFGHSFIWGSSRKDSVAKRILYQIEADVYNTSKQHELYTWMVNVYDKIYTALEQVGE